MDTKINITIYDILSYLFPGVTLIFFVGWLFQIELIVSSGIQLVFITVIGYLIGAILHQIGLLLFWGFYPKNYKDKKGIKKLKYYITMFFQFVTKFVPFKSPKNKQKTIKKELRELIKNNLNIEVEDELMLFTLSDTIASCRKDSDRDILLSKEGLFRGFTSLILVMIFLLLFFYIQENKIVIIATLILLLEISRFSREYYRVLKNQRIYYLAFLELKK
jgi:hypothetical protein